MPGREVDHALALTVSSPDLGPQQASFIPLPRAVHLCPDTI